MNLFDGLQLLELVKDGDVKTYLARDPTSARNVLLHWLTISGSSEIHALLELMDSLPPAGRSLILEVGIREGRMYLITENPIRFGSLKEWLTGAANDRAAEATDPLRRLGQWQAPAPAAAGDPVTPEVTIIRPERAPAVPVPPPAARASEPAPGEFTMVFTGPPAQPPPPAPPKPEPAEGEFTRMFKASAAPANPPAPTAAVPPPAPPPRAQDPGEFTRVFMGVSTPAAPKPAVPPPQAEPGEFTRIFQTPGSAPKDVPPLQPPEPLKPAQQQTAEPGEFTRFFQSPLATPTPPTPSDDYFSKPAAKAPAQPDAGEFTKIFGKPGGPIEPPQTKEATGVFNMPRKPESAPGPSEYTRMFAAQEQPAAPQAASIPTPAPQAAPAATKPKSILPLVLILAFLAVLALVLVFVFIRK